MNREEWERRGIQFSINEPMSRHTSLQVGGKADLMAWIKNDEQLEYILEYAGTRELPIRIIGRGTNILVPDRGLQGVTVLLTGQYKKKKLLAGTGRCAEMAAGAGVTLSNLGAFALQNGLSGMECLAGIPGTLGGALIMNAGAGKEEIGALVQSVRVMNPEGGIQDLPGEVLRFEYRGSSLKEAGIILGARLGLVTRKAQIILRRMQEHARWRRKKQPFHCRSAGSVFKNPEGDSAGRLIEAAGLKGMQIGGAAISKKHANFIINCGNARSSDILALTRLAKDRVCEMTGIILELEMEVIS